MQCPLKFKIKIMKLIIKNIKNICLYFLFFLSGSIITRSIMQVENECLAEKLKQENYKYYKISKFKDPVLVILIISSPTNFERRNVARETWLKLKDDTENIKHFFVVGSVSLSVDIMLHLSAEQSKFNDLLILPIEDSYAGLSHKVLQSFIWLNEQINYGMHFSFVLKCDDDSFVRTDLIKNEIKSLKIQYQKNNNDLISTYDKNTLSVNIQTNFNSKHNLHLYWGYFNGNAKIKTQGKWKETNWILCNNYLPYAQGGGYILSQGLVTYLAKNSDNLILYSSEDVSVGTWLAPVGNIARIHDVRFDTEWNSRGCLNSNLVFHKISTIDMKSMYTNIIKRGAPCSEENLERKYYLYDWTVSPNKCCIRI